MLLEERAPDARDLPRDEALAELARRFFSATGRRRRRTSRVGEPDAGGGRASLEPAGPGCAARSTGGLLWRRRRPRRGGAGAPLPVVHLVQGYDEYIMGYTRPSDCSRGRARRGRPPRRRCSAVVILLDGRVAGFWRRTLKRDKVVVEAALLDPFDAARERRLRRRRPGTGVPGLAAACTWCSRRRDEASAALESRE